MENQPKTNLNVSKKSTVCLSANQIDSIEIALLDAPIPPRPLTRNEALLKLAPTLRELVGRGHNKDSISELLSAQGLTASPRAIGRALVVSRPENKPKK